MYKRQGQSAIRVVGDVTRAGYNLVNGRGVTDTSSIASTSCASLSCQTWTSPQQATEWATRVLDVYKRQVDDQPAGSDTLFQPRHEVLARWLRRRGRGHRR